MLFTKKLSQKIFSSYQDYVLDESPLEVLEKLKEKYGEWIDQEVLEQEIRSNLEILDAWAVSQLNKNLQKQRELLENKGVSKEQLDRRVPLISKKDPARTNSIPLASQRIQLLQNEAYAKHFSKVEDILTNGIIQGKSTQEITDEILKVTDMDARRARFWAEDQASIFFAEQTRIAAIRAGYTHYRWRKGGANSRPSHAVHDGKIFSWNVGVNNLTRPGARHPGEDYRCHCTAELLTAEQVQKLNLPKEPPRKPQTTIGLVENYFGSEELKVSKVEIENLKAKLFEIGKGFGVEWKKENVVYADNQIKGIYYSGKYVFLTQVSDQISFAIQFQEVNGMTEANFDLFFIPKEMQGRGFAKAILKELLDFFQKQGIYKINIFANKDVGGFAWARFGFMINSKSEIENLLVKYGKKLTQSELMDAKTTVKTFYLNRSDSESFPMDLLADKSYGRKLLMESHWNGNLDLRNKKQIKRFYNYIEGRL